MKANILGTDYKVEFHSSSNDVLLSKNDGYTSGLEKKIVLDKDNNDNIAYQIRVMKHEIVHAFLTESGLDSQCWAGNEEIVDWISLQAEKIVKQFVKSEKDLTDALQSK